MDVLLKLAWIDALRIFKILLCIVLKLIYCLLFLSAEILLFMQILNVYSLLPDTSNLYHS